MLIVGSHAMAFHANRRVEQFRTPHDLDIFCTEQEMLDFCDSRGKRVSVPGNGHYLALDDVYGALDFHVAESSPAVLAYIRYAEATYTQKDVAFILDKAMIMAPIEVLYSLKRSHRFLARNWYKHIADYHTLRNWMAGTDTLASITTVKQAETKHQKTPSLKKTKEEFFDDHVSNHVFEHDQIHEVMAHRERPMFEYIADSTSGLVKSSKEKFFALSYTEQCQCVLEEAYVIALERGVIPMLYEGKKIADERSALRWSLMRICTTLCSGWFRDFAVDNFPHIWILGSSESYIKKFLTAVDDGRIKRLEKQ